VDVVGKVLPQAVRGVTWNIPRAVVVAAMTALAVGVPTDVINTGYFTRMTPVRWWEPAVVVIMTALMFMWAGISVDERAHSANGRGVASVIGSALAVGCPVCNKIVVAALGVSGAVGVWAPVQPVLASVSVLMCAAAVVVRWRGATCPAGVCGTAESTAAVLARDSGADGYSDEVKMGPDTVVSPQVGVVDARIG